MAVRHVRSGLSSPTASTTSPRAATDEHDDARPEPPGGGLGREPFVRARTSDLEPAPEVPQRHRQPLRPPLAELLDTLPPDEAIARAFRDYDYRLRGIAGALGCHYSTVGRRLRALEERGVS